MQEIIDNIKNSNLTVEDIKNIETNLLHLVDSGKEDYELTEILKLIYVLNNKYINLVDVWKIHINIQIAINIKKLLLLNYNLVLSNHKYNLLVHINYLNKIIFNEYDNNTCMYNIEKVKFDIYKYINDLSNSNEINVSIEQIIKNIKMDILTKNVENIIKKQLSTK